MAVHKRMPFLNRLWQGHGTHVRYATPDDAPVLRALARRAPWCYLTSGTDEMIDLLRRDPAVVLLHADRIVAASQAGWRLLPNAWLRTVLVDQRVDVSEALGQMLPPLHHELERHGIGANFVTLDSWSDPWLRAPIEAAGYRWVMDVVGYSKRRFDVPSFGNQMVSVRRAEPRDLPAVLRIDAAAFPTPWAKGAEILEPAMINAPYFVVAEQDGDVVGYSYVSLHGTWQAHLVRIAVAPTVQGQGVGVRLLADVVRFCRHGRIELLTLNTQATNTHAQRLYEWFGFTRTGETQSVLGCATDEREAPFSV
jgi:ribosomal protein S18 acetylase RimI-like enzyme